jgi:hypothetical protein
MLICCHRISRVLCATFQESLPSGIVTAVTPPTLKTNMVWRYLVRDKLTADVRHMTESLALGASGAVELIVLSRGVFGGAIPKNLFADILRLIAELRPPPDPAPA